MQHTNKNSKFTLSAIVTPIVGVLVAFLFVPQTPMTSEGESPTPNFEELGLVPFEDLPAVTHAPLATDDPLHIQTLVAEPVQSEPTPTFEYSLPLSESDAIAIALGRLPANLQPHEAIARRVTHLTARNALGIGRDGVPDGDLIWLIAVKTIGSSESDLARLAGFDLDGTVEAPEPLSGFVFAIGLSGEDHGFGGLYSEIVETTQRYSVIEQLANQ